MLQCLFSFGYSIICLWGMVVVFGGYGAIVWGYSTCSWGVWKFYLVVLFGGYGTSIWWVWQFLFYGCSSFVCGVWYVYLGGMVPLFESYGNVIIFLIGGMVVLFRG